MTGNWKEKLFCATECPRCHNRLNSDDKRILSCYDHEAICVACKRQEELQPDYEEKSKEMIGQCLMDVELSQNDPQGYCYSHFYAYKC